MTPEQQILLLSTLIQLEKLARHAETPAELSFVIVNESLRLTNYRQAIFWRKGSGGKISIEAVSGADSPDPHSPFFLCTKNIVKNFLSKPESRRIFVFTEKDAPEKRRSEWKEYFPEFALWCPLISPGGEMEGGILFFRETLWDKAETALLERLADAYAHSWRALKRKSRFSVQTLFGKPVLQKRVLQAISFFLFVLLMRMPVRISVLAPAEIVPLHFFVVSSPADGVIRRFHAEPGQTVKAGQLLFDLDDTAARNAYEVSKKSLGVIQAEYMRAAQKAFSDEKSRENMLLLKAQIEQKSAESEYMAAMLKRTNICAEQAGIAVFGNVSDWLGKPVMTGEKIMTIADPGSVEAEIYLPVSDAVSLEGGADVLIFLNVGPNRPFSAKLRQADYEARLTPEGILAFRVKASLLQEGHPPRIGLRGAAKIYGEKVTLFYYLMRRPLSALRRYFGI